MPQKQIYTHQNNVLVSASVGAFLRQLKIHCTRFAMHCMTVRFLIVREIADARIKARYISTIASEVNMASRSRYSDKMARRDCFVNAMNLV